MESVKNDVACIRADLLIREGLKKGVRGFVFDIKTGRDEEIQT